MQTLNMDAFTPGYTEVGDTVEVCVNGSAEATVDAIVLEIRNTPSPDIWAVTLGILDSDLDFTTYLEFGQVYNIETGQSDQEMKQYLRKTTSIKTLVGIKSGSVSDARAKYEAYLDHSIAAMVEMGKSGLKTRSRFYEKIS